jgi:hypothetical protein
MPFSPRTITGMSAKAPIAAICPVAVAKGALKRQQTDLWAVAVADKELVLLCDRSQRSRRRPNVGALYLGRQRLATLQQCIAAEGPRHASFTLPELRPAGP